MKNVLILSSTARSSMAVAGGEPSEQSPYLKTEKMITAGMQGQTAQFFLAIYHCLVFLRKGKIKVDNTSCIESHDA